jgi:hypothetical protein
MTVLKHISSSKMNISTLFKVSDKQYEQQYTCFSLWCLGLILERIYFLSELDIVNDTSNIYKEIHMKNLLNNGYYIHHLL